jgi:hypothetical protein
MDIRTTTPLIISSWYCVIAHSFFLLPPGPSPPRASVASPPAA